MKFLFIVLMTLVPLVSMASFKKGNGGTAIHCPHTGLWQVLDAYEASAIHGLRVSESVLNSPISMDLLATRLRKISTSWSADFQLHLNQFDRNVIWLQDVVISPVDDSDPAILPIGCYAVQAVVQRNHYYLIDLKIWNRLPVSQQNTLRSHEIIYRFLLNLGTIDESTPVRALNSLLISQEIEFWTDTQVRAYLAANNLLQFLR